MTFARDTDIFSLLVALLKPSGRRGFVGWDKAWRSPTTRLRALVGLRQALSHPTRPRVSTKQLLVKGHARVTARYAEMIAAGEDEVVIPTVVRIEALRGRFAAILAAADRAGLLAAADFLDRTERALSAYRILPITYTAGEGFDRLKTNQKLRKIGRGDLLIACIALAHDATLVTRNTKDFANISGLKLENWAD